MDPALLATAGAWAVFGAARLWHQTLKRIAAEEMATRIEAIVKPMFLKNFGDQNTVLPIYEPPR